MNSVCKNRNRVHWTRFVFKLSRHTCQPSQLQCTQSLNHRHTKFKLQSLPLTLSLLSHEKSSSLSHSQSLPVAPSPAPLWIAPGAVAASRFRRSVSASLSLSPSVVDKLPHKVRTLSFSGFIGNPHALYLMFGGAEFCCHICCEANDFCSIQVPIVNSPTISSSYHI